MPDPVSGGGPVPDEKKKKKIPRPSFRKGKERMRKDLPETPTSSSLYEEICALGSRLEDMKLAKTVYLSVVNWDDSAQSIYAIDLSEIKVDVDQVSRPYKISESETQLLPVLEFSSSYNFPIGMSCVEWDGSRLYFIGGRIHDNGVVHNSPFVFSIEMNKISECRDKCKNDPTYLLRERIVQVAPPMNSPKSEDLYTFVADEKIYAICPPTLSCTRRFEVFDPYGGGEGGRAWFVLPDPPFSCRVTFHLVFSDEKKVLLGTFQDGYFLFDLEKLEWFDCTEELWPTLSDAAPISRCIQLDGLLYWDSLDLDVVCFGPADGVFRKHATVKDLTTLFKDRGSYLEEFAFDLQIYAPENPLFTSLHYLGNFTFSYTIGGVGPKLSPGEIRMILFTVPPSDLTSSNKEKREFHPQVLHVADLVCFGGSCFVNGCIAA